MIITEIDNFVSLLDEHYENIEEFLQSEEVLAMYPKPKKVENNDWAAKQKLVENTYGPIHPTYGKCFHGAKFVLYFAGGKKYLDLKLIKSFEFCDIGLKTTHWFAQCKSTGKVYDPTKYQFCYPGYKWDDEHMKPLWENAKRGDLGNPWFTRGGQRFDHVVPPKIITDLGKLYKEKYGTNGGIDYWIEARKKCRGED